MEKENKKTQRIVVGATVAGVLLALFLIIVLIIQFVQIGVKNSEIDEIETQIAQLEEQIAGGQKSLEYYKSAQWLELQIQLGRYPEGK